MRMRACFAGVALALVSSLAPGDEIDVYQAEIGYTSLVTRLNAASQPIPAGAGVTAMQVEAPITPNLYLPNVVTGELQGEPVVAQNGWGSPSSHATTVGRNFYGNDSSIAPNIASIDAYNANDYLNASFLRLVSPQAPVALANTPKVQNFSWAVYSFTAGGPFTANDIARDALRRFDYAVARDDSIAVVAVGNSAPLPQAFASAYNSITVGMSDALSSSGPTSIDGSGRSKPDIVAPGKFPSATSSSSYAAPKVAAAAALLVETGNTISPEAVHAETVKALLLTGATKETLPSWSHTDSQPLDARYGAGLVNIDNSHRILTAGEQEASDVSLVDATGWDFDTLATGAAKNYFFDVAAGTTLDKLSITAVWLRNVDIVEGAGVGGSALLTPSLANIDLKLYSATGFASDTLLAQSISTVDNVEHVYEQNLPAGRYMISLSSNLDWDFALAWDAQISAVPEPSTWALWLTGLAALAGIRWRNQRQVS